MNTSSFFNKTQWINFAKFFYKYVIIDCEGKRTVLFGLSNSGHQNMVEIHEEENNKHVTVLRGGMISINDLFSFSLYGESRHFSTSSITKEEAAIVIKDFLKDLTGVEYDYSPEEK
jgi:hypothetical protein